MKVQKEEHVVYRYSGGSWSLEHSVSGSTANDHLGFSVSLSDAGTILAIGIYGLNSHKGGVRVYEYSSGSWEYIKKW